METASLEWSLAHPASLRFRLCLDHPGPGSTQASTHHLFTSWSGPSFLHTQCWSRWEMAHARFGWCVPRL